jgi:TPR repeat protein/AcrR family transcriptional regulator
MSRSHAPTEQKPDAGGKPKRTRGGASVRNAIVSAAEQLVKRSGAARLELNDVAKEANLPLDIVTQHFASKNELLLSLAAHVLNSTARGLHDHTAHGSSETLDLLRIAEAILRPNPEEPKKTFTQEAALGPATQSPLKLKGVMPPELDKVMKDLVSVDADIAQEPASPTARLERRLRLIEQTSAQFAEDRGKSAKSLSETKNIFTQETTHLERRIDTIEQQQQRLAAEWRSVSSDLSYRLNILERQPYPSPAIAEPMPAYTGGDALSPGMAIELDAPSAMEEEPVSDGAAPLSRENDDYLSTARRAAIATAETKETEHRSHPHTVIRFVTLSGPDKGRQLRLLLAGGAASLMVLAACGYAAGLWVAGRQTAYRAARPTHTAIALPAAAQASSAAPSVAKPAASIVGQAPAPAEAVKLEEAAAIPPASALSGAVPKTPAEQLQRGLAYLNGDGIPKNASEAFLWLQRAAYQNNAEAQYWLGVLYARGQGVPANPDQAAHWYQEAAKRGDAKAMNNLAVAYSEGTGVPKDMSEAANWLTKAAQAGLKAAQVNLAALYERGEGVPRSFVQAYIWYSVASAQNDSDAQAHAEALAATLDPNVSAAAAAQARAFRPHSAKSRGANAPGLSKTAAVAQDG